MTFDLFLLLWIYAELITTLVLRHAEMKMVGWMAQEEIVCGSETEAGNGKCYVIHGWSDIFMKDENDLVDVRHFILL